MVGGTSCGLGVGGWGVPLVYECCKMVGGTSWGFGVGGWGVPLVYECCKMVGGTSCGLGVGGGGSLQCMSVVRWWVVLTVHWG